MRSFLTNNENSNAKGALKMFINYESILKQNSNWYNGKSNSSRVISWFSGGVASMVTCHLSLDIHPNIEIAFCDTGLEHEDTYRFMSDFEKITGEKVKIYKSDKFSEPEDVWRKYNGLNFAHGVPCSTVLKREVRERQVQDLDNDYCQMFGFDFCKKEIKRAKNMVKNYAEINPKFPLIENEINREGLFKYCKKIGITPPLVYKNFQNNNCLGNELSPKGGCVQGGIGYWQKIQEVYPLKFEYMANIEHELSRAKGTPVTINKDQRKESKVNGKDSKLFLKPNPDYPEIKSIDIINKPFNRRKPYSERRSGLS